MTRMMDHEAIQPTPLDRRHLLLQGSALLLLGPRALGLQAQPVDAQSQASAFCRVEMIFFRHVGPRPGMHGDSLEDSATRAVTGASPAPEAAASPWPELAPGELQLAAAASRLHQHGASYRLLAHVGWTQPLVGKTEALRSPLPAVAGTAGLVGTVRVYRDRFLHAELDIGLAAEGTGSGEGGVERLREARRLRGPGPHYFDHPGLGVILLVTA